LGASFGVVSQASGVVELLINDNISQVFLTLPQPLQPIEPTVVEANNAQNDIILLLPLQTVENMTSLTKSLHGFDGVLLPEI
jgi:hypothetical protein